MCLLFFLCIIFFIIRLNDYNSRSNIVYNMICKLKGKIFNI